MEIIDKIVSSTSPVNKRGVMWLNPASGILQYPSANGWSPIGANSLGGGSGETPLKLAKTIEDGLLTIRQWSSDKEQQPQYQGMCLCKPGYIYDMNSNYIEQSSISGFVFDDLYTCKFEIQDLKISNLQNPDSEVTEDIISEITNEYKDTVEYMSQGCLFLNMGCLLMPMPILEGIPTKELVDYYKYAYSVESGTLEELSSYTIAFREIPSKGTSTEHTLIYGESDAQYQAEFTLKCLDIQPIKNLMPVIYSTFLVVDNVIFEQNDDPVFKYKMRIQDSEGSIQYIPITNNQGKVTVLMHENPDGTKDFIDTEILSVDYLKKHLSPNDNNSDGTFVVLGGTDSLGMVMMANNFIIPYIPEPENSDNFTTMTTFTKLDNYIFTNLNYIQLNYGPLQ